MDNTVENQIISLVEGFINTMIEMHNCDPEEEERLYGIAEGQLLELTDKALFLLGGREEYLETMLFQLISQKLPQGAVIDCFGNFKEELDKVVARTLEVYHRQQRGLAGDIDYNDEIPDVDETEDGETEDVYAEFSGDVGPDAEMDDDFDEDLGDDLIEDTETVIDGTVIPDEDIGVEGDIEDEDLSEASDASDEGRAAGADESGQDYDSEEDADEDTDLEDGEVETEAEADSLSDSEAVEGESDEESDKESDKEADKEPEVEDEDPLGRLVKLVFPGKEVIKEYSVHDILLDYFVPDFNLAFINVGEDVYISNIAELALRKAGIVVVKVAPERVYNIKSFKRQLRRTLSEKNLEEKRVFDLSAE